MKNLFDEIPDELPEELFEVLLKTDQMKLERIVSAGQSTPPGEWYDQEMNEWVILLSGKASILFEGEEKAEELLPGDYILIPARRRHRVESTDRMQKSIWLALHYK